jgi:tetraacyldisaccharide 4'-kinase
VRGEEYFRQLWDGKRECAVDRLFMALLTLPSLAYSLALRLRGSAYEAGLLPSFKLPRPVVAVGNLAVGGTGKTPMVAYLARWFMDRGKRVTVLSRGYGGSLHGKIAIVADGDTIQLTPAEAGDEPYLLARTVPGLSVVIGADRYGAGLLALERLAPDILILDDGFQHLRLRRDLNLLLLDCAKPFGNGWTLPAGTLREPQTAIERADLVVFTRCNERKPPQVTGKPCCSASHRLTGFLPLAGGEPLPFSALKGLRGVAFAGIAQPASFFESLQGEGLELAAIQAFPDHCNYSGEEIETLCKVKEASRADYLITTEKDAVKLVSSGERLGRVYAAGLEMRLADARPLTSALEKLLQFQG